MASFKGPKLPSSKLDLKSPPAGPMAQAKQNLLTNAPRPVITSHTTTASPHPTTATPHPATTRSYSPQRKFITTQSMEQSCKVHAVESPPRPTILSQPRSLFCTGNLPVPNLPVPIHAKNVLDQPNPWTEEQPPCQSASSTHSVLPNTQVVHGEMEIHDGCHKAESGKAEVNLNVEDRANVQEIVGKLDKGLAKGLPRGAMFIQLHNAEGSNAEANVQDEVGKLDPTDVTSELTPLLAPRDSLNQTSAKPASHWKETKEIIKAKNKQLARERRIAASSSKTISEPATCQLLQVDTITPQAGKPVKIQTKEAIRDQRKKDKEERRAESLRRKEESLKKKAEKKLKRQGLGDVLAAGDKDGMINSFIVPSRLGH
ncbi:hypothetical protein NHQ30_007082 [Ciborinia camelliae]|nr:hypothetical protein NHQ30_007082 [Ciborinia camelliae]